MHTPGLSSQTAWINTRLLLASSIVLFTLIKHHNSVGRSSYQNNNKCIKKNIIKGSTNEDKSKLYNYIQWTIYEKAFGKVPSKILQGFPTYKRVLFLEKILLSENLLAQCVPMHEDCCDI